jgi:hypothetical protein
VGPVEALRHQARPRWVWTHSNLDSLRLSTVHSPLVSSSYQHLILGPCESLLSAIPRSPLTRCPICPEILRSAPGPRCSAAFRKPFQVGIRLFTAETGRVWALSAPQKRQQRELGYERSHTPIAESHMLLCATTPSSKPRGSQSFQWTSADTRPYYGYRNST